jgi:hypothetical protein
MGETSSHFKGRSGTGSKAAREAWQRRAPELAQWALDRLVNRVDVWGIYSQLATPDGPKTMPATAPRVADRGRVLLTRDLLIRHFRATQTRHIIGLHSTAPDNRCKWAAFDVDRHDEDTPPEQTQQLAFDLYEALRERHFTPLLTESNGRGGYHLYTLFATPVPAPDLHHLLRQVAAEAKFKGEFFPKQLALAPPGQQGQYGNWLRVVGRHHRRDSWPRIFDGERWLDDDNAVSFLFGFRGDSPDLVPPTPRSEPAEAAPPKGRVLHTIAPGRGSLSDRIAAYIAKIPHRSEGEGRDDIAFQLGAWLLRDMALDRAIALQWLEVWDQGNSPPKGTECLAAILENVAKYARRPLGCGRAIRRPRRGHHLDHVHIRLEFDHGLPSGYRRPCQWPRTHGDDHGPGR